MCKLFIAFLCRFYMHVRIAEPLDCVQFNFHKSCEFQQLVSQYCKVFRMFELGAVLTIHTPTITDVNNLHNNWIRLYIVIGSEIGVLDQITTSQRVSVSMDLRPKFNLDPPLLNN